MQAEMLTGQSAAESDEKLAGEETAAAAEGQEFFDLSIDVEPFLPDVAVPAWVLLQDYPLLLVLLMLVIGYGLGKGIQWLVRMPLEHAARRTKSNIDDHMIGYLTDPITQTFIFLALIVAVKSFGFGDQVDQVLIRILLTILLYFWARAWFRATSLLLTWMSREARFKAFEPRTRPLFDMGLKLVLFSIFIWVFMALWNIDGTAWLASAGVIGIAVGFAARDTLANLISGVSIIADAPYKIGDYIVLDTGERGVVTELGMRSTRLLTRDDVEISIPNAVMGNAKITNESGGPAIEHRIRIPIGVAYGTRPQDVVNVLEAVASEDPMVLAHPTPRVRMRRFGESSIDFELLVWIRLPEQRGLALHKLLMEIEEKFREEGIQIPFPQRDLHIRGTTEDTPSDRLPGE